MSKHSLSSDQFTFIDEVASLLVPWGVPQAAARLYGYILLSKDPVSLDQISAELEVSKSSASVAARLLEQCMLVRRHGERGSKRALYGATDNYAGLFTERSLLLGALGRLLHDRVESVATGVVSERLKDVSSLYLSMHEAMNTTIQQHSSRTSRDRKK